MKPTPLKKSLNNLTSKHAVLTGTHYDAADIHKFMNGFVLGLGQMLLVPVLRAPRVLQLAMYAYNTNPNFLLINEIFACI